MAVNMATLSWGGQQNGRIDTSKLSLVEAFKPLDSQAKYVDWRGAYMRADAAAAFRRMARDCELATGEKLCLSEGYRPYEAQRARYFDPLRTTLAAYPGTSGHGWALSADYGDNPQVVVDWVTANAYLYGFDLSIPSERWHIDYTLTPRLTPASSDYTPIESEEDDDMTPQQAQDLENVKQAVARMETALIGEGKFTLVKNVDTIKQSQARIERLTNTVSVGVGKLIAKLKA
jgi:hypothetical protein